MNTPHVLDLLEPHPGAQRLLIELLNEEGAIAGAPTIITARQIGLGFQNLFGELGPERHVTGHWTAGVRDTSTSHAISLDRQYHRDHAAKGWGGIGYHFNVTRGGVILCLRPIVLKGAHVGLHNSQNVGIMFHGGAPGHDRVTMPEAQRDAFRWLLANGHTRKMPAAHRADRALNRPSCDRRGHNDWPGHETNACPGSFKRQILNGGLK